MQGKGVGAAVEVWVGVQVRVQVKVEIAVFCLIREVHVAIFRSQFRGPMKVMPNEKSNA